MMNQTVIIGRIVNDPEVKELETGKKVANITLAVPRSYKNAEGEYDTDFLDCTLWDSIAQNTAEYCRKGDLVGVKGRVETNTYEKDGQSHKTTNVVAEKITFLSSQKVKENETVKEVKTEQPKSKKSKNIEQEM
jgi:single stranded DNA-binding protein (ssb)